MEREQKLGQLVLHILLIVISLMYILPFVLMISVSFTKESALESGGFSLIPKEFSLDAYRLALRNPAQMLQSYKVTAEFTVAGTILAVLIMGMMAYALSRRTYRFRKAITFYAFFTMLFSGGLVPNYLLNVKYLHIGNTMWVYILPSLVSAWYLIIMRTNFQQIPEALIESAKIDGASEFFICFRIVMPLSVPVLATVGFMLFVAKWNDWYTAVIYIKDTRLYSLQYLLQRILREAEFLKQLASENAWQSQQEVYPTESFRFAMALLAAGPVLVIFPFFQKYLSKGLTVGAVKG